MPKGFLPNADLALLAWPTRCANVLSSDPLSFGVSQAMLAAQQSFAAMMERVGNPQTRSRVDVTGKNSSGATLRRLAGQLSSIVQGQPNVTDTQRVALGLSVRTPATAIFPPTMAPIVHVSDVIGRTVHLQIADVEVTRRGRARDSIGLVSFSFVSDDPPNTIADWRYEETSSAVVLDVTFDIEPPAGTMVWFAAQWLSPRLEASPLSRPAITRTSASGRSSSSADAPRGVSGRPTSLAPESPFRYRACPMRHVISALVMNEPGVLANVAGMFAARGFNIDSLVVGRTENPELSRMTVVLEADDNMVEQVRKQLAKLVPVVKVRNFTGAAYVERDLALITVSVPPDKRSEIHDLVQIFRAKIVGVAKESLLIEISGEEQKIENFVDLLRPYGIKELARTGVIAMARGQQPPKEEGEGKQSGGRRTRSIDAQAQVGLPPS